MADPAAAVTAVVAISAVSYTIVSVARVIFNRRPAPELRDPAADSRLARLEQAVDAIALEVERISEGQRFTTRLLSDQARQRNVAQQLPSHTPT